MLRRRTAVRAWVAAFALAASGAFAALASTPGRDEWRADPEEQFLLDVNIRKLRLGDGVRAYNTPSGPCVVLGDFITALDVPVKVDLAARKASGWAFKESHVISIDLARGTVRFGTENASIAANDVRETPEGWCVATEALSNWFSIGVKPATSDSTLFLESEARLPVELAMERQQRAAALMRKAKFDIGTVPRVKLPYRLWRAPALDFVVSAGATYRADNGVRVDRQSSVYAAGEIAQMSYVTQVSTDQKGRPTSLRLHAYRSDPEAGLLGPLKATHIGVGDVEGFDSRLSGSSQSGLGALVTNRPLLRPTAFGRTRFEGDLPSGWEAEIYRNNELVAFAKPSADQRYVFDDVELQYGDNDVRIVLYGPQGQVRTREETINVGQENVPAGKTWYWAGFNQPSRELVSLKGETPSTGRAETQASLSVEHGIDERTSAAILARTMLIDDERLTFVEGTVRRSIGKAAAELAVAYESGGGRALGAEMIGRFGSVNVRGEALLAKDFLVRGRRSDTIRDVRLSAETPLHLGKKVVPVGASVRVTELGDGKGELEATLRASASIERFNLGTDLKYRKETGQLGRGPPTELEWSMIGSGRVGNVRLRGISTFRLLPDRALQRVELSGYWSGGEQADWEGGVIYDAERKRSNARISHIRRLNSMAVAVTAEAASDKSLALGLNLNFSLDPDRLSLSRQPLASAGAIRARVYQDLNDNGVRDRGEPLEKDTVVTTGTRLSDRRTGADGSVTIGGLTAYQPVLVGVDQTTLRDPSLAPRRAMQMVVPRPGVFADVEIGLVGAGAIEGAVVKSGGVGFEGVDLELLDANGKVVAVARSDFDGFFLFDRVPFGKYRMRIAKSSADAARVVPSIGGEVVISSERSVVRLGTIDVQPLPQIASAAP